ncbi:hypothetical protein P40081_01140 [Paenibacillus sp. FSL P4-0081]|uniref:hyaluronate lyase N-terminal domain-containing protein n=1 Tax=Paenibacillus sp. FSL P4-0081 TaxID=1536769 RepID=UPI0004F6D339|nr:hypothetical protein [Paenibacillus sp. FSL P4-0081]AIQ26967.1 hypothetical protein P40081_01140 [Paenibacillus sp. FSL P4-0081]
MANKIQFKRGLKAQLPTLAVGEPGLTTDTLEFFVGSASGNIQMATNKDLRNVAIASAYGVNASIGTVDATALLNGLFTLAKAAGKRIIYFDIPHTYVVTGDLTNARDLILVGDGAKIKSSNLNNYFIQIADDNNTYNERYNSFPETGALFKTASIALTNKAVNVTIWGDSISTGGSDVLGIKYGMNHKGPTEQSPQGLTPSDSYYLRLIDMLTAKFPDVSFNFYNRAVGGALIQNSEDNQTFNGVTKAWSAHIKDTNPDILLMAFGMNTSLEYSKTFRFCMDRILSYIDANYTKKPSICWLTTPRSTMALGTGWGDYGAQLSRHLAAYAARYSGLLKGGYIIDAGRVSDIKRTGFDFTIPTMREMTVSEIVSGTYSESGGVYTFDADGETMNLAAQASDFVIEFDLSVTGAASGTGSLWFGYNSAGSESVCLFFPNLAALGQIQNYTNFIDSEHYSYTADYVDSVSWNGGTWKTIRIEKRAEVVNIYVNGVRVIRDTAAVNNLPGSIRFLMNGTGSAIYKIRNLKLYKGNYKQYVPTLTERDMWGAFVDGDYNTKAGTGGNGVNHPSTTGLDATYLPVLREFVDDLALISQKTMLSLGLIPIPRIVSTWQTAPAATSTSGANLRYQNVPLTDFPGVVSLTKPDGTRLTLRKDIQKYDDAIKLLAGEFAVYASAGLLQVFIAFTGTIEASYTITAYYYA